MLRAINNIRRLASASVQERSDDAVKLHFEGGDNNNEEKDVGWTNINEQLDMSLEIIWPLFNEMGLTQLSLPDIEEGINVKPLFITYSAKLWLTKGFLFNIKDIKRFGNALMTYNNKSFQFRAKMLVRSVEFTYDFQLNVIGFDFISGTIGGVFENTQLLGVFSISADTAYIQLHDFQIVSFGNIGFHIIKGSFVKWLSGTILRPITRLFNEQLTTTISGSIKEQIERLICNINDNDRLQLQKFLKEFISRLLGQAKY